MKVQRIEASDAKPWILERHYAKRMPQIQHCFGLFDGIKMKGVVAYGLPANRMNNKLGQYQMIELVRLSVSCSQKNASSMLVGRSLKMLPKPLAVISYADSGAGHVGYIYQATNWHYTGISKGHPEYTIDGKVYHEKNVYNRFGTGSVKKLKDMGLVVTTKRMGDKHRYYFFLGTKRDKRNMINALNFPLIPYPKGKTKRHNFDEQIETQSFLFI